MLSTLGLKVYLNANTPPLESSIRNCTKVPHGYQISLSVFNIVFINLVLFFKKKKINLINLIINIWMVVNTSHEIEWA